MAFEGSRMRRVIRFPTLLLVMLSLAGVATGNLFRPCDCGMDGASPSSAQCHVSSAMRESRGGCCGGCEDMGESRGGGDDKGCRICCKPRPAFDEADGVIGLDKPDAHGPLMTAGDEPESPDHPARAGVTLDLTRRPAFDPWLLTPEGLSVFLI